MAAGGVDRNFHLSDRLLLGRLKRQDDLPSKTILATRGTEQVLKLGYKLMPKAHPATSHRASVIAA
jgi:hypothetical protein